MAKDKKALEAQAEKILKMAEDMGVQNSFFFVTTFKRYRVQLSILDKLEGAIEQYGDLVTKEYVKGRENLCINPAITEYNKTSTACNGTLATLLNIVKTLPAEDGNSLVEAMKGLMQDD